MELYKEYREYQAYLGHLPETFNKYTSLDLLVRLKYIILLCGMQHASKHMYNFKRPLITRFDHSLNDAKITWNLTHDEKMTLASLFHDVATPTWSHVVDYMNKDYITQESTEEKTEELLTSSKELMDYLKKDGISIYDIVDFKKYSICDLPRPKLCADRIENTLSSAFAWMGNITLDEAKLVIDSLYIDKNSESEDEIALNTRSAAKIIFDINKEINRLTHTKEDNYMMLTASKILKRSIEIGIVDYNSLYTLTEPELFNIITENLKKDSILNEYWTIYRTAKTVPEFIMPETKEIVINPLVNGKRYIRK